MKVHRVRFILADEAHSHDTYISAEDPAQAVQKLTNRFPGESKEIRIESIDKSRGTFVIGPEDQTF